MDNSFPTQSSVLSFSLFPLAIQVVNIYSILHGDIVLVRRTSVTCHYECSKKFIMEVFIIKDDGGLFKLACVRSIPDEG
jgi:hypothetical protein